MISVPPFRYFQGAVFVVILFALISFNPAASASPLMYFDCVKSGPAKLPPIPSGLEVCIYPVKTGIIDDPTYHNSWFRYLNAHKITFKDGCVLVYHKGLNILIVAADPGDQRQLSLLSFVNKNK